MKNFKQVVLGLVIMVFSAASVWAADAPSADLIAQGRKLFNEKEGLGAKYACIMCHKQGKEIKKADLAKVSAEQMPTVINKYLTQKSKGKAIAPDSQEMKALIAYIQSEHSK